MNKISLTISLLAIVSAHTAFSMEPSKSSSPVLYNGSPCVQGFDTLRSSMDMALQTTQLRDLSQLLNTVLQTNQVNILLVSMQELLEASQMAAFLKKTEEFNKKVMALYTQAAELKKLICNAKIQEQLEDIQSSALQLRFCCMQQKDLGSSSGSLDKYCSA